MSLQKLIDAALTKNFVSVQGARFTVSDPKGKPIEQSKTPVDFTVGGKLDLSGKNGASIQYVVTSSRPLTPGEKDTIGKAYVGMIDSSVRKVVADYNKRNNTNVKIQKGVVFKTGKVNLLSQKSGTTAVATTTTAKAQEAVVAQQNSQRMGMRM